MLTLCSAEGKCYVWLSSIYRYLRMLKQVLLQATEAAAAIMKEYSNRTFTISNKEGINNLVTEVDHKSEEIIFGKYNIINK